MKKITITTEISEINNTESLDPENQELIQKASDAAKSSWSPYSGFAVGAAVRLANGIIIPGANIENAAFPSGICAEHAALSTAASAFPNVEPTAIAITAFSKGVQVQMPVAPCGKCRQVIAESENRYKRPIKLFLAGKTKIYIVESASDLLPLVFSQKDLNSDVQK